MPCAERQHKPAPVMSSLPRPDQQEARGREQRGDALPASPGHRVIAASVFRGRQGLYQPQEATRWAFQTNNVLVKSPRLTCLNMFHHCHSSALAGDLPDKHMCTKT